MFARDREITSSRVTPLVVNFSISNPSNRPPECSRPPNPGLPRISVSGQSKPATFSLANERVMHADFVDLSHPIREAAALEVH
jgi:hypothetical protein